MEKFDKLLYEVSQRDRLKMLAYFMINKDLLENESYNYICKKLVDIECEMLEGHSYDYAKGMVEMLTKITLDIYGKKDIEKFKDKVDYFVNLI